MNSKILEFIYDRMVNVHGENPNVDYMIHFRDIVNEGIERYILCYNYSDETMIFNRVLDRFVPYNESFKEFCIFRKDITNEMLLECVKKAEDSDLNSMTVHEFIQYKDGSSNPKVRFANRKNI